MKDTEKTVKTETAAKTEAPAPQANQAAEADPDRWEELVDFESPLLGPEGENRIFVCVNGEALYIPRGEKVKIKRKFAEALRQSALAEREALRSSAEAQRQSRRPLAEW